MFDFCLFLSCKKMQEPSKNNKNLLITSFLVIILQLSRTFECQICLFE